MSVRDSILYDTSYIWVPNINLPQIRWLTITLIQSDLECDDQ